MQRPWVGSREAGPGRVQGGRCSRDQRGVGKADLARGQATWVSGCVLGTHGRAPQKGNGIHFGAVWRVAGCRAEQEETLLPEGCCSLTMQEGRHTSFQPAYLCSPTSLSWH